MVFAEFTKHDAPPVVPVWAVVSAVHFVRSSVVPLNSSSNVQRH
jgi:hypothetical protein